MHGEEAVFEENSSLSLFLNDLGDLSGQLCVDDQVTQMRSRAAHLDEVGSLTLGTRQSRHSRQRSRRSSTTGRLDRLLDVSS
ncbi:hypothetical protein CHIBA101_1771 [Actinomyces sp. Chiba101]|nr:hypothetical protein CHIBA101_1771 [Actinomyces sp. Chiba101]